MNRRRIRTFLPALVTAFFCASAVASSISRESLPAVRQRSQSIVIGELVRVGETRREGYWQSVDLRVRALETLSGTAMQPPLQDCSYREGLPHQRGDTRVWPLSSGSGIEFGLKAGDRVILLLAAAAADGACEVLRAEPLANRAVVTAQPQE